MSDVELAKAVEFIRDRLYYVTLRAVPRERPGAHFFCIDDELVYWNFFLDFGPLNLGQTYRFCQILSHKLHDKEHAGKRIYFYSGTHSHKRTNAAFLICAYAMLYLGRSPEDAFRPFSGVYPPFPPFHDATPCACTYNLTILDCLRGMARARECKFFDFDHFDIDEYEHYEKVENGDLNWIVAGKFLAFAGPHDAKTSSPEGYHTHTPDDYIPYFKKKNVSLVVRLNKKYYNEKKFTDAGIDHIELYYLDGSNPPEHILKRFLEVCEATPGSVAVHCKAGLGRTGSCIGAYVMKHWGFTAAEFIGWTRVCRPGSVIGPQQHYLEEIQARMWADGDAFRRRRGEAERDDPSAMMSKLAISQVSTASSGDRSARRPGSSKLLTAAGRAATSSSAAPVVVSAYMGVSGSAGGYAAFVASAGPSSPTARAAADKRPTVLTGGSSGFVLSSPAAAPGTPDSYESDVSQGDHLLAARDRAKRSPTHYGGGSPLARATGASSSRR